MAPWRQLLRLFVPKPDVVELPDVRHCPQLEAPDAALAAVLEHFERDQAVRK